MNILIPHKWLLEHLQTDATPQTIQKIISLSGPSVERIYEKQQDSVYDIEVTTNRVDSMSVRGIARECAVILNHAGIDAKLKHLQTQQQNSSITQQLPLPKINNNPNLSKRLTCVILKDVKRAPTPDWMATRLQQIDMNVHDAVIDITNYVTHELGHPCHAFDYDKLMKTGGEINISEAKKGEQFTTLDGENFTTVGGEVVFKNGENQIIDLPSIKGTANTSVDDDTKNVLLLLESIKPEKVRFASMTHAIRTTAAQLMEKNVDPHLAEIVLKRGIDLYKEICDAKQASEIYDDFPGKQPLQSIEVKLETINNYLGIEISVDQIVSILKELECGIDLSALDPRSSITVTPPTFRPDLQILADIVEEIARIYGYHNLPSVLIDTAIPLSKQQEVDFDIENKIKHFLSDIGWQELYTYSMVSEELALQSGYQLNDHVTIQNPLTDDRIYMRNSLIPSLNEMINNNPMEKEISIFEIANIYRKKGENLPDEIILLSMLSTKNYRQVKGDLESMLSKFFINEIEVDETQSNIPLLHQSGIIKTKQQELGTIGIMENERIAVTINISNLTKEAHKHPSYLSTPNTAQIIEDLTFTLPSKSVIGEVLQSMKVENPLIKNVSLKDVYQQNFTFTFTYQDETSNLSGQEIEPIRKALIQNIENKFGGNLVGKV